MWRNYRLPILIFSGFFLVTFSNIKANDANNGKFSYDDYALILKSYVDSNGMVDYKQLKTNREKLDGFIESMSRIKPKSFDKWSEKEKVAFWLNAYNALTLKAIIDNYPIKASRLKSAIYPKNSIRQIKGVWDKIKFDVMGKDITLGDIEHKILRVQFNEPRIHMAMVCAAMGCPPLLNEPYLPKKLDEQLDDQSRKFLSNPLKYKVDGNTVYLSPIFNWFKEDFVKTYGPKTTFAGYKGSKGAVLNFMSKYLEENKKWTQSKRPKIKYLKYDWSLNEQAKSGKVKK
ncbi:MAG: DUF547 domain-containing protein [Planctomycetota bacterium]|jgi:hypothetical protein